MKKTFASLFALLLIVAMLAGCGGAPAAPAAPAAPSDTNTQPTTAAAAPTTASADAAAPTEAAAPTDAAAPTEAAPATTGGDTGEAQTITVWDYYGEATPIKPLVEKFEKENPNIKVKVEALDWNTMLQKLNVVLTGGDAPDVVTIDMTWLPRMAALGAFTDLNQYANGKLNGVDLKDAYTEGALDAMTYDGQLPTMMCDFDVYALYYRSDLFEAKGLKAPTTWDELKDVASKLADGEQNRYQFQADTFHTAQFIFENGGSLLSDDNSKAVFNSPEAVEGVQFYADMLKNNVAINWTADQGERVQGLKDGRIAMFSDGPYVMGIMKSSAPEMAGKWKVAMHPYSKQPGSYLGGTGLSIPVNAAHKEAGYKFIEFAMREENQINFYKIAGAAPALTAALNSDQINVEDPYFGNEKVFSVFLESMKTAKHFPYVRSWSDIDTTLTTAMQKIALDPTSVQATLDEAATETDDLLSQK
jgi:multiple sugar transport system substrate-binding protein